MIQSEDVATVVSPAIIGDLVDNGRDNAKKVSACDEETGAVNQNLGPNWNRRGGETRPFCFPV